jgi:hypothetical protein
MLSAFVALRARGIANVIWLAAATAVIYAFVNAVTKSGVDLLTSRGAGVLATWEPHALMAAGILSGLFGQSAFSAGPLSPSLPVIDTVEPVCSVILAAAVFQSIWRGHRGCLRSNSPAVRSRRPGLLFSAILRSCWRRSAANPGRPGSRKSTELLNGKPFPGAGLLAGSRQSKCDGGSSAGLGGRSHCVTGA